MGELAGTAAVVRHMATHGGDRSARPAIAHATFPVYDDGGDLRAGSAGVAGQRSREVGQFGELETEVGQNGTAGTDGVLLSD